jgi:hypothetical protein
VHRKLPPRDLVERLRLALHVPRPVVVSTQ